MPLRDYLLPFGGLEWTCPKCGGTDSHLAYQKDGFCGYSPPHYSTHMTAKEEIEHFHRHCRWCQYEQAEFIKGEFESISKELVPDA